MPCLFAMLPVGNQSDKLLTSSVGYLSAEIHTTITQNCRPSILSLVNVLKIVNMHQTSVYSNIDPWSISFYSR